MLKRDILRVRYQFLLPFKRLYLLYFPLYVSRSICYLVAKFKYLITWTIVRYCRKIMWISIYGMMSWYLYLHGICNNVIVFLWLTFLFLVKCYLNVDPVTALCVSWSIANDWPVRKYTHIYTCLKLKLRSVIFGSCTWYRFNLFYYNWKVLWNVIKYMFWLQDLTQLQRQKQYWKINRYNFSLTVFWVWNKINWKKIYPDFCNGRVT
jgi:hypothetical protein